MRKTWRIRYHPNSFTLSILPLFCAKIGKEIVLSAPYYRYVIALSPHIFSFKAQIKAVPKIKLYDKWSHKTPYQKTNIRKTFRFSRLWSQLQGNYCDKLALGITMPVPLCVCVYIKQSRFSLRPHIIVLSRLFILGVSILLPAPEKYWRAVYVSLFFPFSSHRAEAERQSNLHRSATIQPESLMTENVFSNKYDFFFKWK